MSGSADSSAERELCLGDLGERGIQETLLRPRYQGTDGFGDDCAFLGVAEGEIVATTDTCPAPMVNILAEPDLYHAGWLLATINLSDLAAAGATPLGLVVNYTLPKTTTVREFRRLLDGVDECAAVHGTRVVGGDIRDGESVHLSATAIGRCVPGSRIRRSGAAAGDRLLLIGSPGYLWAAALLAGNQATLPAADAERIWSHARRPMARVAAGRLLAEHRLLRAAMDVSDGLFPTVRTLCESNGLGAAVTSDISLDPAVAAVAEQAGLRPFDLAQTWGDWTLVGVAASAEDVELIRKCLGENDSVHEIGTLAPAAQGLTLRTDGVAAPWQGRAQERFSPSSWHGGDLSGLIADVLGAR